MTAIQLYMLIVPFVLLGIALLAYWISGIYDDPRRHRHHPGE
ncbi:hypothetical protein [Kaistia sp. 32K]|nr:hypothetical protein [Kaistia sp. 32K]